MHHHISPCTIRFIKVKSWIHFVGRFITGVKSFPAPQALAGAWTHLAGFDVSNTWELDQARASLCACLRVVMPLSSVR